MYYKIHESMWCIGRKEMFMYLFIVLSVHRSFLSIIQLFEFKSRNHFFQFFIIKCIISGLCLASLPEMK